MKPEAQAHPDIASMTYAPQWRSSRRIVALAPGEGAGTLFVAPARQAATLERLRAWYPRDAVMALDATAVARFASEAAPGTPPRIVFVSLSSWKDGTDDPAVVEFLRTIKSLADRPELHLTIVTVDALASPATRAVTRPVDGVYIGIGQTLAREFPHWRVDCVSLATASRDALQAAIESDLRAHAGRPVVLDGDTVWSAAMAPIELQPSKRHRGFRRGGTYMIIGANGGIGGVLAKHLARTHRAQLVLVGRSPANAALVAEIERLGGSAVYERVDLADGVAVKALVDRHPHLDGVVHSALMLEDASLANMNEASLLSVLRPKVHGTIHLADALRERDLDFVLMFSSIQSYIANAGQANYTAACVAKDAIAALMRDVFMIDARVVNWGFWGSIGIVASEPYRERMRRLEIGSIEPDEGIAIVEALLRSDVTQITVVKASEAALRRLEIEPHQPVARSTADAPAPRPQEMALLDRVVPAFDPASPAVSRNIAASHALQRYAANRLAQVPIPVTIAEKHRKLATAIASIRADGAADRSRFLAEFPEMAGHAHLLDVCLDRYPDILSGRIDPLTVMFPEGSFELVEPIYRDNPLADYFNRKVAEVVARFVAARGDRPVRVLEIGAGTGSTAQFVLPVLPADRATYVFTDLSYAFLNKARRRFTEYPFVRYEIFNVETPPSEIDDFDVVVATNVIHATSDLPEVLRNVRERMAPGGIFVLNEITSLQDYATLTFGLTEGWWLSVDPYRIPDSPLVSGEYWQRLLLEAGFRAVRAHGGDDQQVIVAVAPGLADDGVAGAEVAATRVSEAVAETIPQAVRSGVPVAAPAIDPAAGETVVAGYIRRVIAEVMQAEEDEIDFDQPFNEYGIDSLIALELLKPFRADLGYLPATVLFEYPTIRRLAQHFIAAFGERAITVAGGTPPPVVSFASPAPASVQAVAVAQATPSAMPAGRDGVAGVRGLLRHVIAETMLMEIDTIEDDLPFMEYGIDSIISLELMKPLRQVFGYLPATLLFEYPSVSKLSAHLAASFPDIAAGLCGPAAAEQAPTAAVAPPQGVPEAGTGDPRPSPRPDDIAIIGMAGRFPDADDVDALWRNLAAGHESAGPVPEQRWPRRGALAADTRHYTAVGAFIADVDAFDNTFFGITPLEAERMDPQERLFLQTAYHALEDAGRPRSAMRGSETGVFVGVMNGGYAWHRPRDPQEPAPTSLFWSIANRTSYLFDLKGPSMAVDTACSSSLTALHLACNALRADDCDHALVGGVNLIAHPRQYDLLCGMHMLSADGHCRPFGDRANGFVDGEGVCCLVLKRYADAVRDEDRILAVVRGTAINADGQSNGYSAPNPEAQARVIAKAIERAGLRPAQIDYLEAHGTGTELGDPIEIRGLCAAFGDTPLQSVAIGSLKGNLGHLESAAGLTGVVKVLLQMRHGQFAPSINAEVTNAHLRLDATPFRLQRVLQRIPVPGHLVASVSSYGAGGANAHAVLQSVPVRATVQAATGSRVATLSARSASALQRRIDALRAWLASNDAEPEALAWTLNVGREHFPHRAAYVFESAQSLHDALAADLRTLLADAGATPEAMETLQAIEGAMRHERPAALALARAYMAGNEIPWSRIHPQRQPAPLPGYAFDPHRFWIDSAEACFHDRNDIVHQHDIDGVRIAPAAWALSQVMESTGASRLTSVLWRDAIRDVHSAVVRVDDGRFTLGFADADRVCCEGEVEGAGPPAIAAFVERHDHAARRIEHGDIYRRFESLGYRYGRDLRPIRWARISHDLVETALDVSRDWGYRLSPALIDGALQSAILLPALQAAAAADEVLLPYHLGAIEIVRLPRGESIHALCSLARQVAGGRSVVFNIRLVDERGRTLVELREMTSLLVKASSLRRPQPVAHPPNVAVFDIE